MTGNRGGELNHMAILALITKPEAIRLVVPWVEELAKLRVSSLIVAC